MQTVLFNLRSSIRGFLKSPIFTITLLLLIALGIGATTTIFTIVNSVILNPLPVKEPERLVTFFAPAPPGNDRLGWWGENEIFSSLCEYRAGGINLTDGEFPVRVSAAAVSPSFFSVFELTPQLGRSFAVDESSASHQRLAIISNRLWANVYGREQGIIGHDIQLSGIPHLIVGVMPDGFAYPGHTDIWLPLVRGASAVELGNDEQFDLAPSLRNTMVGRLRQDVSFEQCRAQLALQFERLKEISMRAGVNAGSGFQVLPLQDALVKDFRLAWWVLFGSVVFLLLIACSNVTNLLLVRAFARRREVALRLCLGASPGRVFRELLTESVLLSLVGGLFGVALAFWGVDLIRASAPLNIPQLSEAKINGYVLCCALAVSLIVGVVVGTAPALQALSIDLVKGLKDGGIRSSNALHKFTRNSIVVFQIALSLVLVIGAGLMARSFFGLTSLAPGFDSQNVLTMTISLPRSEYFEPENQKPSQPDLKNQNTTHKQMPKNADKRYRAATFHLDLIGKVNQLPGVVAAGGVSQLPLNSTSAISMWLDSPGTNGSQATFYTVTGDYFEALGISLMNGRYFTEQDGETSPKVMIINQSLAQFLWEGESPLGRTVTIGGEKEPREVIGVVKDVKQKGLIKDTEPQFYIPYLQALGGKQPPLDMTIVVKSTADSQTLVGPFRSQVASLNKDLPIFRVRTMSDVLSESIADFRFRSVVLSLFALLAISLAGTGVYGVIAYSVSTRNQEIGIRMSLGATPSTIIRMILKEGAILAVSGAVIGVAASFATNRFIASLLYGVKPSDPWTLFYAVAILLTAAFVACALPAWIAGKVEPVQALRQE